MGRIEPDMFRNGRQVWCRGIRLGLNLLLYQHTHKGPSCQLMKNGAGFHKPAVTGVPRHQ